MTGGPGEENPFERPETLFRIAEIQAVLNPERELRFRVPAAIQGPMRAIQATVSENTSPALRRSRWEPERRERWRLRGFTFNPRCQPLAFEYHAFLFAERRTLEYLAVAVARFFDRDCHRIKGLASAIAEQPPPEPRKRVEARLRDELPTFGLSDGGRRDARDRLAHWEAVDAGQINVIVTASGEVRIAMFGGEEGLSSLDMRTDPGLTLSKSVGDRLERLTGFVLGCFSDLELPADVTLPNR